MFDFFHGKIHLRKLLLLNLIFRHAFILWSLKTCLTFIRFLQGMIVCWKYNLCLLINHLPVINMTRLLFFSLLWFHVNIVKSKYPTEQFMFKLKTLSFSQTNSYRVVDNKTCACEIVYRFRCAFMPSISLVSQIIFWSCKPRSVFLVSEMWKLKPWTSATVRNQTISPLEFIREAGAEPGLTFTH